MVEHRPYIGPWTEIETSSNGHGPQKIYIPFSETERDKIAKARALYLSLEADAMKEGGGIYSLYDAGSIPWGKQLEHRESAMCAIGKVTSIYRQAMSDPTLNGFHEGSITEIVKNLSYFSVTNSDLKVVVE